ncbi:MAG: DEAD/DEAH box helicase, partial [Deltaproteobacteria bacterium]
MSFEHLGLQAELLGAVAAEGYTSPTPIQARAIPVILEGRDVLGGAQTGTGKTAAFALPILQLLNKGGKGRLPRALILTPTRELAAQVEESVRTYGRNLPLRSTVIYGGVGINPQIEALRRGVDILVATPGRLLDHAGQGTLNLSKVEILVLDEADRMLDMGFINDIR